MKCRLYRVFGLRSEGEGQDIDVNALVIARSGGEAAAIFQRLSDEAVPQDVSRVTEEDLDEYIVLPKSGVKELLLTGFYIYDEGT